MLEVVATVLAGFIIGFTAGVTNEPAAGHITAGVTGFIAGILGAEIAFIGTGGIDISKLSLFFIIYLVVMYSFYLLGNWLRVKGKLKIFFGKSPR